MIFEATEVTTAYTVRVQSAKESAKRVFWPSINYFYLPFRERGFLWAFETWRLKVHLFQRQKFLCIQWLWSLLLLLTRLGQRHKVYWHTVGLKPLWKCISISIWGAVHKRHQQLRGGGGDKKLVKFGKVKNYQHRGGRCQKSRKIADVFYGWHLNFFASD